MFDFFSSWMNQIRIILQDVNESINQVPLFEKEKLDVNKIIQLDVNKIINKSINQVPMDVDESSQSEATVTSGKETPVPEEAGPTPSTSKSEQKVP